ncbi:phage antirepressor KilAC domain-containing protein [Anabaena catenula]|uniref:Phage antirepressor KilAC domain-containing protein n=1 Tax=Anabaena catenula FACHB-362 TaxID=2692877 RepID=A0ABR8JC26_9NOST|nr:phage antirepressor KilAC domain-containing protein [Anabaena catenula]MBD2694421.1 phage antirepressor KilAC domain-containing protein [Anabaena catenula FACHB-362]
MTTLALSAQVLRAEKDGIEFYTIQETGESGMSQSGLARACGVDEKTIRRLLETLRTKSPSEILEPFTGSSLEDLTLRTTANLNNANILRDTFCASVITHFAQSGKVEAAQNVCAFAAAGIRTFIHSFTGWQPQQTEETIKLPTDLLESLKLLVVIETERKALAAANEELQAATTELQAVNSELLPKAEAAEVFLESGRNLTFQEAAQLLAIPGIGRDNLFKALIELKLLINTAHPYQRFIEQGIFFVKETSTSVGFRRQILITPKGMGYILPLLKEHGKKSSKVADSFRPTPKAN